MWRKKRNRMGQWRWLALGYYLMIWELAVGLSIGAPPWKRSYKEIIKQINGKGPYIGLITVYPPEEEAFFSTGSFEPDSDYPFLDLSGRRFRVGKVYDKRVIYVKCGVGLNPNAMVDSDYIAGLDVKNYNVPKDGENLLGHIGFKFEQFYSDFGKPNTPQPLVWAQVNQQWLRVASKLQGMELQQCVNSTLCLENKPKLVVGLRGSTSDIFVDNASYRDFLFHTFQVSSSDMESFAVVMTSLSNGFPVIAIRGLSDIAGGQEGTNTIELFGSLAALNTANSVVRFLKELKDFDDSYNNYM